MGAWEHVTGERARERRAVAILKRIGEQTATLASRLADAQDTRSRFGAIADALRAAGAPGKHQPDQAVADQILERVAEVARQAFVELTELQRTEAEKVLAKEERRRAHASERAEQAERDRHAA